MRHFYPLTPEQDLAVFTFSIIPNDSLRDECENEEHESYLDALQKDYRQIGCEIKNYFHGDEMFLGIEERLNKEEIQFFINKVDRYISLYGLVQFGWKYIKKEIIYVLRKCGINKETEEIILKSFTPGVFYGLVITGEALSRFLAIKSHYFKFIARNEYNELLKNPGIDSEIFGKIFDDDLDVLDKLKKTIDRGDPHGEEYDFLYSIVRCAIEKNKNKPEIKERHREYMRILGKEKELVKKHLHPRRKPTSIGIINQKIAYPFC
jgi:hypothetical protein